MTELEYKLLSTIGSAVDMVADFSDEMDMFACEVDDEQDYKKAHDLAYKVSEINDILANAFNETVNENKEEWNDLLMAECKIISKQHFFKERRISER